jgi:hypothetical protein
MQNTLCNVKTIAIFLSAAICSPTFAADDARLPLGQPATAGRQFKCELTGQSRDIVFVWTETGDSLCLPRQYLRRRDPANATASAVWVEASFPDASPLGGGDGEESGKSPLFLAAGNVSIVYRFGFPNGRRWLNRSIGEQGNLNAVEKDVQREDPLPDNTLEKRLRKNNVVVGLDSYLVDPERIRQYLMRTRRSPDDAFAYSSFDDWHLKRERSGEVVTLIRCAAEPVRAAGAGAAGRITREPPAPLCTHLTFRGNLRDRDIEIRYRKSMLYNWMDIEKMASILFDKFASIN